MSPNAAPQSNDRLGLSLSVSPACVRRWLVGIIGILTAVSVGIHLWKYLLAGGQQRWFVIFFDLGAEHSIPTYYQVFSLLLAGLLLQVVARSPQRTSQPAGRWWSLLGFLFCLLSVDELCQMHEQVGYFIEKSVHPHGFFRFGWVVAAIPFVVVLGAIYLRFLYQLPARFAVRFIIAGAIYVGGAVGMEMVSGNYAEKHGEDNLTYNLLSDTEEFGEMTGIGIFIVSLVSYLAEMEACAAIAFTASASPESLTSPNSPPVRRAA